MARNRRVFYGVSIPSIKADYTASWVTVTIYIDLLQKCQGPVFLVAIQRWTRTPNKMQIRRSHIHISATVT